MGVEGKEVLCVLHGFSKQFFQGFFRVVSNTEPMRTILFFILFEASLEKILFLPSSYSMCSSMLNITKNLPFCETNLFKTIFFAAAALSCLISSVELTVCQFLTTFKYISISAGHSGSHYTDQGT